MKKIGSKILLGLLVIFSMALMSQTAYATETENVSTWDELRNAIADTNVSVIILEGNIERTGNAANHLPAINRDLRIEGNNFTIDFGNNRDWAFRIGRRTTATSFTVNNLNVANIGAPYFLMHVDGTSAHSSIANTANWLITLNNFRYAGATTQAEMVNAQASAVVLRGNVSWETTSTRNSGLAAITPGLIVARELTIYNDAIVELRAINTIFNMAAGNKGAGTSNPAYVNVYRGAVANLHSGNSRAAAIVFNSTTRNTLQVVGGGQLFVTNTGDGSARNADNQVMTFRGGSNVNTVNVYEDSRLEMNAHFGPVIHAIGPLPGTTHINVLSNATFIAHGRTSTAATGTLDLGRANIFFDNPALYDIGNWRPSGGNVITNNSTLSGSGSTFRSYGTTLEAWRNGVYIGGNPSIQWDVLFNYSLNGGNFNRIGSSSLAAFNNTANSFTRDALVSHSRIRATAEGQVTRYISVNDPVRLSLAEAEALFNVMTNHDIIESLVEVSAYQRNADQTTTDLPFSMGATDFTNPPNRGMFTVEFYLSDHPNYRATFYIIIY